MIFPGCYAPIHVARPCHRSRTLGPGGKGWKNLRGSGLFLSSAVAGDCLSDTTGSNLFQLCLAQSVRRLRSALFAGVFAGILLVQSFSEVHFRGRSAGLQSSWGVGRRADEPLSLWTGLKSLLLVAILMYLASYFFGVRPLSASSSPSRPQAINLTDHPSQFRYSQPLRTIQAGKRIEAALLCRSIICPMARRH
jgi:hypothetical protein